MVLQSELSEKTTLLARFQQDLHDRCSHILKINRYGIYQDKPQDVAPEGEEFRYIPDSRFLPKRWSRYQITTKTDTISAQQLKELEDYLHSGGDFSTHWEPVGWIKRIMDWETSLAFHKLVESRAPSDSIVPLNTLLMWLKDILLGRKSIHAHRKILLQSFGRLGGMGKNGANTEGYITEIKKEREDCQMWNFKWTDMQVLMVINTLNSSNEDES